MKLACLRCGKLAEVEFTDERGAPVYDEISVDVEGGGLLTYVCVDCMTKGEVLTWLRKGAVAALEAAEEAVSGIEMVMERIEGTREDPRFKASLAEAQEAAALARARLDALLAADEEDIE